MILTDFLDQTLEAAKQSAQQIYGDDLSVLRTIFTEEGLTEDRDQQQPRKSIDDNSSEADKKGGVVFERSDNGNQNKETGSNQQLSKKLNSIRQYAAQQSDEEVAAFNKYNKQQAPTPDKKETNSKNQLYSRSDIRQKTTAQDAPDNVVEESEQSSGNQETEYGKIPLYDHFVENLPDGVAKVSGATDTSQKEQTLGDTLEQRLDRMESLIHLALSSPDTAFSQHPLFHKLLHKGVSQKMIKDWFSNIAQQQIHPEQQPELFESKLEQQIFDQLKLSTADSPAKHLLFTGRSGAGKTHLIMKLASLPGFMRDQKIGVAAFLPENIDPQKKYSILEPFCRDSNIDFYPLPTAQQADKCSKQWSTYDHILIDTPALEMCGPQQVEQLKELKNRVYAQAESETHYLINTALNGTAFNDPLAQEIEADHIALTHIDQSLKWGKTVQLLANTDYKLRYICSGPSVTDDLLPFNPQKYARKLLRA